MVSNDVKCASQASNNMTLHEVYKPTSETTPNFDVPDSKR